MSDQLSEAQLLQFREGSSGAFAAVYDAYVKKVYQFVFYRTLHRETAEDVTSDAFLKMLEHRASFDPSKGSMLTWLFRIARNTLIDHIRSTKPHVSVEEAWDIPDPVDSREIVARRIDTERVASALKGLTAEQREIVLLRAWHGMTFREIGETMDKSEAASKMAFVRTVKRLRETMPLDVVIMLLVIGHYSRVTL